jgi:hypothetical protein
VPVDRKRYCEAMAKVADAYCDLMESMSPVKEPIQTTRTYKPMATDILRNTGRTTRAVEGCIERLKRHRGTDGICYVVSHSSSIYNVEQIIALKYGLTSDSLGYSTLHVCGSPFYIRHVGNMNGGNIKGEPLYVMDHSVRELLAEKNQ